MSTSATYQFHDSVGKTNTTIYIHYDGYFEGAAHYLYYTLINPSKGNMATQFIRANSNAEIISGHDQIYTDYCYDIWGNGPDALIEAYRYNNEEVRNKECLFSGNCMNFIEKHNKLIENFFPFQKINLSYSSVFFNEITAKEYLKRPVDLLQRWKGKYEGSANWNSCLADIKSIVGAFPTLTEFAKEFVT